jgi:uncharacterized protein involved in outer membrane biogenesis
MSKMKWIAVGLLALLVISGITVYVILSSYDFNDLKPEIAQAVKDATGRELTLKGDIDLKISLTPALVVEDVAFQNAPWGSRPDLATIKRVEVEVSLLPLLSGDLELNRLVVVEPDILIETDKTGRSNLEFEKPQPEESAAGKAESSGKSGSSGQSSQTGKVPPAGDKGLEQQAVWIKELSIVKALLQLKDGQSGQKAELQLDELLAGAQSMRSPLNFSMKGKYNRKDFEYKGQVGALAGLTRAGEPFPIKINGVLAGTEINLDGKIRDMQAGRGWTSPSRSRPKI